MSTKNNCQYYCIQLNKKGKMEFTKAFDTLLKVCDVYNNIIKKADFDDKQYGVAASVDQIIQMPRIFAERIVDRIKNFTVYSRPVKRIVEGKEQVVHQIPQIYGFLSKEQIEGKLYPKNVEIDGYEGVNVKMQPFEIVKIYPGRHPITRAVGNYFALVKFDDNTPYPIVRLDPNKIAEICAETSNDEVKEEYQKRIVVGEKFTYDSKKNIAIKRIEKLEKRLKAAVDDIEKKYKELKAGNLLSDEQIRTHADIIERERIIYDIKLDIDNEKRQIGLPDVDEIPATNTEEARRIFAIQSLVINKESWKDVVTMEQLEKLMSINAHPKYFPDVLSKSDKVLFFSKCAATIEAIDSDIKNKERPLGNLHNFIQLHSRTSVIDKAFIIESELVEQKGNAQPIVFKDNEISTVGDIEDLKNNMLKTKNFILSNRGKYIESIYKFFVFKKEGITIVMDNIASKNVSHEDYIKYFTELGGKHNTDFIGDAKNVLKSIFTSDEKQYDESTVHGRFLLGMYEYVEALLQARKNELYTGTTAGALSREGVESNIEKEKAFANIKAAGVNVENINAKIIGNKFIIKTDIVDDTADKRIFLNILQNIYENKPESMKAIFGSEVNLDPKSLEAGKKIIKLNNNQWNHILSMVAVFEVNGKVMTIVEDKPLLSSMNFFYKLLKPYRSE